LIVVDASALLEVLLGTCAGARIQGRLFRDGETLHAPHLIDLEVAQVLRRYGAAGELDPGRGAEALEDLAEMPLNRYHHDLFLSRIWELRQSVTAYDAAYIAIVEAPDAPLVTRDVRLTRATGRVATIETG